LKTTTYIILILISLSSCEKDPEVKTNGIVLNKSSQRTGDKIKGRDYLLNGDYLSSGIPLETYKLVFPADKDDLGRQGISSGINYQFTTVTHPNGAKVVSQNCLTCHATKIDDKIIIGLGNNLSNYTANQASLLSTLENVVKFQFGQNSKEYAAFEPYLRSTKLVGQNILTNTFGVNPANNIFAVLAGNRNAQTLEWLPTSNSTPDKIIPTDVPPWWLMKKKNALYYNGLGEGDFGTLIMTSSLLTMKDKSEAEKINEKFSDVISFINDLTPPSYPYSIDKTKADKGQKIFVKKCSSCHGKYEDEQTYPNLLIPIEEIDTDEALVNGYKNNPQYHSWFNDSWFANNKYPAYLKPKNGYIAPPLDGVWATAPYFHNGSSPSLADVLDSNNRPKMWKRTSLFNDKYDNQKLGWSYISVATKTDEYVYDTAQFGMNNKGHYYGDKLSATDRSNLLEYLKTL
jgi:cytochrome c2